MIANLSFFFGSFLGNYGMPREGHISQFTTMYDWAYWGIEEFIMTQIETILKAV
jgi:hypothetical protein